MHAGQAVGPATSLSGAALRANYLAVRSRLAAEVSLAREVWSLAWPAMTHMFLVTLVFLVNRAMVGRYSSTALASMQISTTLVWTAYSLFTAFSAGTLAVVARSVGAGDRAAGAVAARASVTFALALGLVVTVPIVAANGSLLHGLFPRADAAVLAEANAYLGIVVPVLPIAFVEAIAAASLQGAGDTRTPLYAAVLGNVVNVAVSAVLIFGAAGFPELGVRGAAIGAAAATVIEGVLLAAALLSPWSRLPVRSARREPSPPALGDPAAGAPGDLHTLRRVLRVSIPTFAEKLVYHAGYLGYVAIIGLLGATAMASNQALVSIEAICFLSADGIAIAAGAVVAQKLGAGRDGEASRAGVIAAAMAVALLSAFGVAFALAPRLLMTPFSTDAAIVETGTRALYVAAFAQPFMAFATVVGMSLRGAGATRTVLAVTFVCGLLVRLSATWLFAITLGYGLVGVWLGSTADWLCRTALLGVAYSRGGWKRVTV